MKPQRFVILLGLSALLVAAGPARADWLVTREGARVETQGAWKVKGKLVVFQTADGKLSSLRVADVDLDASRRVTEEAVAAQAQAAAEPDKPAERRKSVRVITDKDVRQASPAPAPGKDQPKEGEEGGEAAPSAADTTSGPVLLIEAWDQARDPEKDHVLINGTLQNTSISTATDLKLKVLIFDETGTLIATSQAAVAKGALPPGERAAFKAEFPGYFSFATVQFDPKSRSLSTRSADQPIPPAPP